MCSCVLVFGQTLIRHNSTAELWIYPVALKGGVQIFQVDLCTILHAICRELFVAVIILQVGFFILGLVLWHQASNWLPRHIHPPRLSKEKVWWSRKGEFCAKKTLEDPHLICVTQTDEASDQLYLNSRIHFFTERVVVLYYFCFRIRNNSLDVFVLNTISLSKIYNIVTKSVSRHVYNEAFNCLIFYWKEIKMAHTIRHFELIILKCFKSGKISSLWFKS